MLVADIDTPAMLVDAAALDENIGVWPDITNDYMTTSNLLNNGADFVNAFTKQIVSMIP